jgi:hypothetical protein
MNPYFICVGYVDLPGFKNLEGLVRRKVHFLSSNTLGEKSGRHRFFVTGMEHTADYDYIIIGSGFGGSVSALRLSERGYRVLVIEKGKWYRAEDFARTNWQLYTSGFGRLRCAGSAL